MNRFKTLLCVLLTVFCVNEVLAQDLEYGAIFKGKESFSYYMGEIDGTSYVNAYTPGRGNDDMVALLDDNMNIEVKEIEIEYLGEKHDLESVKIFREKVFVFTSTYDKKSDEKAYYFGQLDKKSMRLKGDMNLISKEIASKKRRSGGIDIRKDSTHLMAFIHLPFVEGSKETLKFMIFEEGDDLPKEYNIELPYSEEGFSIYRMLLKKKLYIQGGEWIEGESGKRKDREYKRHFFSIDLETNEVMDYDYDLGDDIISDHRFIVDDEGNIMIAGFYSHNTSSGVQGIFYLQIDGDTKKVSTTTKEQFSEDFMLSNYSDKQQAKIKKKAEKKDREIQMYNYDLDHLILNEGGGVTMVGERYYTRTVTTTDSNGNRRTTTYYYYGDIITCSVNAQGEIMWVTRVPKNQVTSNDGGYYSSYSMFVDGDKIHFLYNDHIDNQEKTRSGEMRSYRFGKNGCITLGTVFSDGLTSREVLIGEKMQLFLRPKIYRQLNDEELLVLLVKKKQKQFAKVKF